MRIRINHTWQVIATLIAGAVFAVFIFLYPTKMYNSWVALSDDAIVASLAVAAMAGGAGLGVERIRSRGDVKAWGIGRWSWSLSALSIALAVGRFVIARPWQGRNLGDEIVEGIIRMAFNQIQDNIHDLSIHLCVFLLASMLARFPRDAAPDFREWSGRAFGCLVIAWGAAFSLITALSAGSRMQ